jgi:hypothetical protein
VAVVGHLWSVISNRPSAVTNPSSLEAERRMKARRHRLIVEMPYFGRAQVISSADDHATRLRPDR